MSHTLKIGVSKCQADVGIISCHRVDLRERLLRLLFGEKRRLTILVPGDSVKTLSIVEEAEEGEVR